MDAYQMDTYGEVIDAGIDYISLTMLNDNPAVEAWTYAANAYLQELSASLGEINASKRLGYEGNAIGGSFVGRRPRDTIAIYSGERAKTAFDRLYRRDTHVSRLDVQVSFRFNVTTNNVAQVARNSVERANRSISGARQRNATLMEDLRGGATCYVGTRTSEQFARIYNKDAESGQPEYERVWRYEVQLKNKLAVKCAEQIASQTYTSSNHALVFVKQWLSHRGVRTPWKADAELLPLPKVDKPNTQVEQKLDWLRTQVRPTLRGLLKYGLRDAILEALGLDDREA
jgi:DNA relaxase NicK